MRQFARICGRSPRTSFTIPGGADGGGCGGGGAGPARVRGSGLQPEAVPTSIGGAFNGNVFLTAPTVAAVSQVCAAGVPKEVPRATTARYSPARVAVGAEGGTETALGRAGRAAGDQGGRQRYVWPTRSQPSEPSGRRDV